MNEDSCDVWAHPEYFYLDLSAGAPPDMYSPQGQNWGFPTYNWQTQEKDGFAWWQNRLKIAEKYYQAYRIDHVLGFFRIWTAQRTDTSSLLGRYVPYTPITEKDLKALGFDSGRIRWLSQPHIPTGEVWDSLKNSGLEGNPLNVEAERVFTFALDRIGGEELWMFKPGLRGEKDIEALGLHPGAAGYLLRAWTNRLFLEYEKGKFFPVWYCRNSRGWASLSEEERVNLEGLLKKTATGFGKKLGKTWGETAEGSHRIFLDASLRRRFRSRTGMRSQNFGQTRHSRAEGCPLVPGVGQARTALHPLRGIPGTQRLHALGT
jgi:4-alpha-glucanotransferase